MLTFIHSDINPIPGILIPVLIHILGTSTMSEEKVLLLPAITDETIKCSSAVKPVQLNQDSTGIEEICFQKRRLLKEQESHIESFWINLFQQYLLCWSLSLPRSLVCLLYCYWWNTGQHHCCDWSVRVLGFMFS